MNIHIKKKTKVEGLFVKGITIDIRLIRYSLLYKDAMKILEFINTYDSMEEINEHIRLTKFNTCEYTSKQSEYGWDTIYRYEFRNGRDRVVIYYMCNRDMTET